jgi:hypothetical protein
MTSLNVSDNSLGVAAGWTFSSDVWWLNGSYPPGHSDSHPCNRLPIAGSDASGVILLAGAIKNNEALTSLNMSKNHITGAEAGKALGDALAGNTVLKELDLSGERHSPNMDIGFVQAFTPGLSDNGALIKLGISGNYIGATQEGDLQRICVASGIELAFCSK